MGVLFTAAALRNKGFQLSGYFCIAETSIRYFTAGCFKYTSVFKALREPKLFIDMQTSAVDIIPDARVVNFYSIPPQADMRNPLVA